jgi:hypothetical protein
MNRTLLISGLLAGSLALTACDRVFQRPTETPEAEQTEVTAPEQAAPELPVRPAAAESGASIDWEAARRDLAARSSENPDGAFQVASGGEAPPVPVFLPSVPVVAQGGEAAIRFQPTSDGYYAFFPGEAYDTIVNGTNVVIAEPGAGAPPARTDAFNFQPTTTGAQVAFSRYGADYLVEFECKEMVNGLPACITEEQAVAFARDLAISGTR